MWKSSNYLSYGLGSSSEIVGRALGYPYRDIEMDLVRVFLELGLFPLFVFVFCYVKLSGRRLYSYMASLFLLGSMLVAGFTNFVFGLYIVLLSIMCTRDRLQEMPLKQSGFSGKADFSANLKSGLNRSKTVGRYA
ncbi:MAG: hypothetical protein LBU32_21730 [Clostridiales bacterium]|nr:hypothetical protein [Clostridiales bacterium]